MATTRIIYIYRNQVKVVDPADPLAPEPHLESGGHARTLLKLLALARPHPISRDSFVEWQFPGKRNPGQGMSKVQKDVEDRLGVNLVRADGLIRLGSDVATDHDRVRDALEHGGEDRLVLELTCRGRGMSDAKLLAGRALPTLRSVFRLESELAVVGLNREPEIERIVAAQVAKVRRELAHAGDLDATAADEHVAAAAELLAWLDGHAYANRLDVTEQLNRMGKQVPLPFRRETRVELRSPDDRDDALHAGETAPFFGSRELVRHGEAALAAARAGSVQWRLLTGAAGVGRTRIAREIGRIARAAGSRVLLADGRDVEPSEWQPLSGLVETLSPLPEDQIAHVIEHADDQVTAFERVTARIKILIETVALGGAPLVVIVDDLESAAPTAVRCLAELAFTFADAPVLFLLTLRDGWEVSDIASDLTKLTDSIASYEVEPLRPRDARALTEWWIGPLTDDEARRLPAGGNPSSLEQFVFLLPEERVLPERVEALRLKRVEADVLRVLLGLTVVGDQTEIGLLTAATMLDAQRVGEALHRAKAEHLIRASSGGGHAFRSELLAAQIRVDRKDERRRMHARVAFEIGPSPPRNRIETLARHLIGAGGEVDVQAVVDACLAAAKEAQKQRNSTAAADWYEHALNALDERGRPSPQQRDDLLVARVEALARAGKFQTVQSEILDELISAQKEGRPTTVGRLSAALTRSAGGWPWARYGENSGALLDWLSRAEGFLRSDPAALARVAAAVAAGRPYVNLSTRRKDAQDDRLIDGRSDALSQRAIALAEGTGDPDVLADALLGRILAFSGLADKGSETLQLIERLNSTSHDAQEIDAAIAYSVASLTYCNLTRMTEAENALQNGIDHADRLDLPTVRAQLFWMEGAIAAWRGDFDHARAQIDLAVRVHQGTELYGLGSESFARNLLDWQVGTLGTSERHLDGTPAGPAWAAALAAYGHPRDDELAKRRVEDWLSNDHIQHWDGLGHAVLLGHVVVHLGFRGPARRLRELLEDFSGHFGNIGHVGIVDPVDTVLGRLSMLLGDDDSAAEYYKAALRQAHTTQGRPAKQRLREYMDEADIPEARDPGEE